MFKKGDPQNLSNRQKTDRRAKETFGLDIKQLRQWSEIRISQELSTESAKQEIAVSRVRGFLDAVGKHG